MASITPTESPLIETVRTFTAFGQPTIEQHAGQIRYLVNEFWTAGQRQGHSIHGISYRACFKPQLPAFFIERLTEPGDAVLDPFMGRCTTPIQTALMGRRPIGNDVNPLSVMLTRPRLAVPDQRAVAERLEQVAWHTGEIGRPDLLVFYSPATLRHICALRWYLLEREQRDGGLDPVDDWIRMVAINRLTGHSPGFFSVYTLPPNQAVLVQRQAKISAQYNQIPPDRDVLALIVRKTKTLLKDGPTPPHPSAQLLIGTAQSMPAAIARNSVALVVTSPPFMDTVDYSGDNHLRTWFAGIDPAGVHIEAHRTELAWQATVRASLTALSTIVRPGGHIAFEVGEVRGGRVLLERLVWDAAEGLPFDRLAVVVNQQEFTKTANCWGVTNGAKGTNSNRIVVLRRQ